MNALEKCAIHTITTKPWSLEDCIEKYARAGVGGITLWRDKLIGKELSQVRQQITDAGLATVALVRSGFFPAKTEAERAKAHADNVAAIEEAAAVGAPQVVLVCGAVPGIPLADARQQIQEGIAQLLPLCEKTGVKLSIEPLHPMYADSRSAINTLKQANDLVAYFRSPYVGVAIDVYHVWWDDALEAEIKRCGELGGIFAFHVCDWKTPTEDLLMDRGLMGEGCIDIPTIRGWVEAAGFDGFNEVEIFSTKRWNGDQDAWLKDITTAYQQHV